MDRPPEVLALLAEPVRWQLLVELGRSDRRVGELVRLTGRPQNVVSYHLGELRTAGIVTARRSSADGRDVYYAADLLRCRELLGVAVSLLHPGLAVAPAAPAGCSRRPQAKVLFLCSGNSARSQIAEALMEHRSAGAVTARSAGSHPKPVHPDTVRVLAERGIDISGRASKPITRFSRSRFDRVITLCDKLREACPELPAAPTTAHWSIADPSAEPDHSRQAFRAVTDEIDDRVQLLFADLTSPTSKGPPDA